VDTTGDKLFQACAVTFLSVIGIIVLYPFWHVLVGSVLPYELAIKSDLYLFPTQFTFEAYEHVFTESRIVRSLIVSVFLTITVTAYQLMITAMTAYSLTKKDLPGRGGIILFIVFTMFFSGGLIPYYLVIKQLGMINSYWSLIVPAAMNTYNFIVMKTFFESLPAEMEEAGKIDGAGYGRMFIRLVLPLSLPVLASIGLFIAVEQWNSWYHPMLFIGDREKWPLTLILRDILISNNTELLTSASFANQKPVYSESLKYAVIMVSITPIVIVYPFIQRYFAKGVMIGAIK
jgi:putative aldouronate transport system permease protein